MTDLPPLLHKIPSALARIGSISRTTLYERIAAGEIEVVKIGRTTLIPDASLQAFVDRLRTGESSAA